MICEEVIFTIQIVSNALSRTDDQPFGNSSADYTMGLVTCVRSRIKFRKNQFFGLWKNAFPTLFIYEKMLMLEFFSAISESMKL